MDQWDPVDVEINHLQSADSLVTAPSLSTPPFAPPTFFSAPLPSGSGARALGIAGAFTAIADDATAASWNPAGLIQLQRPEASIMFRMSREMNQHSSGNENYEVGKESYGNQTLNYLSFVYPFQIKDRNLVFSANYQEAYDFTQTFSADSNNPIPRMLQTQQHEAKVKP